MEWITAEDVHLGDTTGAPDNGITGAGDISHLGKKKAIPKDPLIPLLESPVCTCVKDLTKCK